MSDKEEKKGLLKDNKTLSPEGGNLPPLDSDLIKLRDKEIRISNVIFSSQIANTYEGTTSKGKHVIVQEAYKNSELSKYLKFKSEVISSFSTPLLQKVIIPYTESEDRVYLVLEKVEGKTLEEKIQEGLSFDEFFTYLIQVSQSLKILHEHDLVFTSLTPENIVCSKPIKLKNIDYLTKSGEKSWQPVFVPGFTAPEITEGRPVSPKADIFSVGAILYYFLTGQKVENLTLLTETRNITIPGVPQILSNTLVDESVRYPSIDHLLNGLLTAHKDIRQKFFTEEYYLSSIGLNPLRLANEDSYGILDLSYNDNLIKGYFVADGMGGLAAGEVASQIAIKSVEEFLSNALFGKTAMTSNEINNLFKKSVEIANSKILEEAYKRHIKEMGTTFTGLILVSNKAFVAHVGDSRCYLFRNEKLQQLTEDHSLVQVLVNSGEITKEQARVHPDRNVITRSLGSLREMPEYYIDTLEKTLHKSYLQLREGDIFLLCSDGVWDLFSDEEIENIILEQREPKMIGEKFYMECLNRGAPDNFTLIVVKVNKFNPEGSLRKKVKTQLLSENGTTA